MRRFNIILYLINNCKSKDKLLLKKFLSKLTCTLENVDDFYGTIFSKIFQMSYLYECSLSQEIISFELGINQSTLSKNLRKIDDYIKKTLLKEEYRKLNDILKRN